MRAGYPEPLGAGRLPLALALWGARITDDKPHRFTCGGGEERGLVLPEAIFESGAMQDIQPLRDTGRGLK